jgi:competence protein ComEC
VVWSRQPEWWILLLSSVGIIYVIRPGLLQDTWRSRVPLLCVSIALLTPLGNIVSSNSISPGEFKATIFDIGQGTAVFIETANKTLLYDTGPIQGKKDDAGQRILLPYFRGRGIDRIDRMVISHSDSDHVGGAAALLKHIKFESMMGSLPSDNPLLQKLQLKNVPSIPCRFGQRWIWDGVEFFIWHPREDTNFVIKHSGKPNEMSCVLEVRNQNTSFWMTGDVEKQGEAEMVERLDQVALETIGDRELIFMAPHHGSKTSSSEALLKRLNPDHAFAQNGYRNRYGHPHPTVVERYRFLGIPFIQTPETGAQIWRFKEIGKATMDFWRLGQRRLWHRDSTGSKMQKALKN